MIDAWMDAWVVARTYLQVELGISAYTRTVVLWLVLLPHNKKVPDLNPPTAFTSSVYAFSPCQHGLSLWRCVPAEEKVIENVLVII